MRDALLRLGTVLLILLAAGSAPASEVDAAAALKASAQQLVAKAIAASPEDGAGFAAALEDLAAARKRLEPFAFDGRAHRAQVLIDEVNTLTAWVRLVSGKAEGGGAAPDRLDIDDAQRLYERLMTYEEKKRADHVMVAARMFSIQGRIRGTDWARWLAVKGQGHVDAATAAARKRRPSPDEKLSAAGDALHAAGKFQAAAETFAKALAGNPGNAHLIRRYARALYCRGCEMRNEYLISYAAGQRAYMKAGFSSDREGARRALLVIRSAEKIALDAEKVFAQCRDACGKLIKAGGGKDIEAEIYVGLSHAVDPRRPSQLKALELLGAVVGRGGASTARERMLLDHGKNELGVLKKLAKESPKL